MNTMFVLCGGTDDTDDDAVLGVYTSLDQAIMARTEFIEHSNTTYFFNSFTIGEYGIDQPASLDPVEWAPIYELEDDEDE